MPNSVAAVITVNDMYHELQGVREAVQNLAGKFEDMPRQLLEHTATLGAHEKHIAKLDTVIDAVPEKLADHEVRIRILERRTAIAVGGVLLASAVASSGLWAVLVHH